MKKRTFKWIASVAMMVALAMLFTQCESEATEIAPVNDMNKATAMLGDLADNYDLAKSCECLLTNFPLEELSALETSALLYMREEEKLAHDVYAGLFEKWGNQVFENIAASEQRHTSAIFCLLNKYGLEDPVGVNGIGIFNNVDLQSLYESLMEQGTVSLAAAFRVGATIEDLDISDLETRLAEIDNQDIAAVFKELAKGSRNHLRAFNRNLEKLGEAYAPQFISQEMFDEIVNSSKETGGGICGVCTGQGNGKGQGNCNGPNGQGNGNGGNNGNGKCKGCKK
jgi:hypothetical protein